MLVINKKFIERWSGEYDRRARGTYEEAAILDWLSKQGESKFLNKEYFIRLGRWKTPRYQETRKTNNEQDIIEATRSAYEAEYDLEKLNILRRLKGVGIAVASTILYYLQPDKFAIYDYHIRNSLEKAGKLTNGAKVDSSKVWLEYTQIIRKLSTLYNKTPREVEKALFAYDIWGCGESEANDKDGETGGDNEILPAGIAIVEAKNNPTWGIERPHREIVVNATWTTCLVCRGGPLDLSIVKNKYGASLSHKLGKQPYLWIPVKVWIKSTMYDGKLRYGVNNRGACITNPLNNGKNKLGHVMTSAGFAANEKVHLKFIGNEVWVVKVCQERN
jgi:hypothetical protein